MPTFIDLTGKRFGRLTITEKAPNHGKHVTWLCRCDCGNQTVVIGFSLKSGDIVSCGCRRKEGPVPRHGQAVGQGSSEYCTWASAKERCFNPKCAVFKYYGGRGITMYPEWRYSYEAFFAYIGPRPAGQTLDRIDNNGNYEPGNVRWATRFEQTHNRRPETKKRICPPRGPRVAR